MINPIEVCPGIYRGSHPETAEDFQVLKNRGIVYLLDLQTGATLMKDGGPLRETLTAEGCGLRSYAHPLGEILPPTRKELQLAVGFIESFQPVYVHCKVGVDRTGMVIGALRRYRGWARRAAILEMREKGMHWWLYWWGWFLP